MESSSGEKVDDRTFEKSVQTLSLNYRGLDFFDSIQKNPQATKHIIQQAEFRLMTKSWWFYFIGGAIVIFGLILDDPMIRAIIIPIGLITLFVTNHKTKRIRHALNGLIRLAREFGKIS